MELLTKDNLALLGDIALKVVAAFIVIAIIAAVKRFTGFTRGQKLKRLQKRREDLKKLNTSDREYYGRLLSGCLGVLALFALEMMFEGLMTPPPILHPEQALGWIAPLNFMRYGFGIAGYVVAISRLHDYRALQDFDRTIKDLNQAIAKLESKVLPHSQSSSPNKEGEAP